MLSLIKLADIIRMSIKEIELPQVATSALPAPPAVPAVPAASGAGAPRGLEPEVMHGPASNAPAGTLTPGLPKMAYVALEKRALASPESHRADRMGARLLTLILDAHPDAHPDDHPDAHVRNEDIAECFGLIGAGANLTLRLRDVRGLMALGLACFMHGGNEQLSGVYKIFLEDLALTIIECPDMYEFLNVEDESGHFRGKTPLMYASQNGMVRVVSLLAEKLKNERRDEGIDKGMATALYYACKYSQPETAMILINAGANVNKGVRETSANPDPRYTYNTYPLNACYDEEGNMKAGMGKVAATIQYGGGTKTGGWGFGGSRTTRRHHQRRKSRKQKQRQRSTTRRRR